MLHLLGIEQMRSDLLLHASPRRFLLQEGTNLIQSRLGDLLGRTDGCPEENDAQDRTKWPWHKPILDRRMVLPFSLHALALFLGVLCLAEADVDRVAAVEKRNGRTRTDSELAAQFHQQIIFLAHRYLQ